MDILTFILVGLVGIWLGYTLARRNVRPERAGHALISEEREEKENNKNRVLVILGNKGSITNDDVEEALSVSDATASRYLSELEEEGKIRQVGETGRGVYYVAAGNPKADQ